MVKYTNRKGKVHRISEQVDLYRTDVDRHLDPGRRIDLGQFMTPAPIASFMASLFQDIKGNVTLLDPGAGAGSLTSAFVDEATLRRRGPSSISVQAWEVDSALIEYLKTALDLCSRVARTKGINFNAKIQNTDFIGETSAKLGNEHGLFPEPFQRYTHCIVNPPYRKINGDSPHRDWLRQAGIETTNLYTGFLALAIKLLLPGGELVAIVPRSFCNGVYFKNFRRSFLEDMSIRQLHVFTTRDTAFKDNEVLQENIIIHAVRSKPQGKVVISTSHTADMDDLTHREVDFDQVVFPNDSDMVINIIPSTTGSQVAERMRRFGQSLSLLGINVSTGAVVDFRCRDVITDKPSSDTFPLIFSAHFTRGFVEWPKFGRKPDFIKDHGRAFLMPNGWYVLTRRFSSKEEKRRIVIALHDPERVQGIKVGFENHLNVFHQDGQGLDSQLAKGLAIYLGSTLVDLYFRQFSGHTQVNASDLRSLPYPDRPTLLRLGSKVVDRFPDQKTIDDLIEAELMNMNDTDSPDPVQSQRRIQEALEVLTALGLPRAQRNERSALTLLALLNLAPDSAWSDSSNPMIGITPIMDFAREQYGRQYAPNTRETFRRFTMHQFVQAGIAILNPDSPHRPVNSPATVYQIEPQALALIQHYGSSDWGELLASYREIVRSLTEQYARQREMNMIPLVFGEHTLQLTPGSHSELIKAIIEQFGPRFSPGAEVLYVGDTGAKMLLFEQAVFSGLGLHFDSHGKFPDVVMYWRERNWLLLVESVTSHGPVDPKRHAELATLFSGSTAGLVYVTAFPDRQIMARYLGEISWETEVWVADAPSHLIHFNGERFLGPH